MPAANRSVRRVDPAHVPLDLGALIAAGEPVVLEGLARDWPLVRAGLASTDALATLLRAHDAGRELTVYVGDAAIRGRFHYDAAATGMNFRSERLGLPAFLDRLLGDRADDAALYLGSTDLDLYFPGLGAANALAPADDTFARHPPVASIWIGNRTVAAAHYDMSNNAAVCVAGHRRFTLFPPDTVAHLYPGPLAPTPGGQVVSMVDPAAPDLALHPDYPRALAVAQVAELAPGDVLVYPALWWHQVEALDAVNVLVNYWWNAAPAFLDTPMDTLLHALLSLRDRPAAEKAAWRAMFDHYVFGDAGRAGAHLPAPARGPLAAPLDADQARRLRAYLLHRLNR